MSPRLISSFSLSYSRCWLTFRQFPVRKLFCCSKELCFVRFLGILVGFKAVYYLGPNPVFSPLFTVVENIYVNITLMRFGCLFLNSGITLLPFEHCLLLWDKIRTKMVSCLEVFSIKRGLGSTSNNGLRALGSISLKLYKWIFPLFFYIFH